MTGETKPGVQGPDRKPAGLGVGIGRKPRCDSPLRTLPEPFQARIMELLALNSYRRIRQWLAQQGIRTTELTLIRFRRWYLQRHQQSDLAKSCDLILAGIQRGNSALTPEQVFNYGHSVWSLLALKNADLPTWNAAQKSWLQAGQEKRKERSLALREEKARLARSRPAAGKESHV